METWEQSDPELDWLGSSLDSFWPALTWSLEMEALEWVELDLVGLESSMEGRVLEMETSGRLERSMKGLRPTMFMLQEMEVLEWSDLQLNWLDRSMEDSRAPEALSVEFWLPTLTLPVDMENFWVWEAELEAEKVLRAVAIVMEDFIPAADSRSLVGSEQLLAVAQLQPARGWLLLNLEDAGDGRTLGFRDIQTARDSASIQWLDAQFRLWGWDGHLCLGIHRLRVVYVNSEKDFHIKDQFSTNKLESNQLQVGSKIL